MPDSLRDIAAVAPARRDLPTYCAVAAELRARLTGYGNRSTPAPTPPRSWHVCGTLPAEKPRDAGPGNPTGTSPAPPECTTDASTHPRETRSRTRNHAATADEFHQAQAPARSPVVPTGTGAANPRTAEPAVAPSPAEAPS